MFSIFLITACSTQLKIKNKDSLQCIEPSVEKFVVENNFDEALVAWTSSNWMSLKSKFYALIKQKNKYYLAQFTSTFNENSIRNQKRALEIRSQKLKPSEISKLYGNLDIDQAFKYSQKDLNKLPENCTFYTDSDSIVIGVYDLNYYHLLRLSNSKTQSIYKYAPDYLLKHCAPFLSEYKILEGFVNTFDQLTELVTQTFKDNPVSPIQNRAKNY